MHPDATSSPAALEAELKALQAFTELLSRSAPLKDLLACLCQKVEDILGYGRCSILLLDPDGIHVRHGAGPSLPRDYMALIDGAPIGPQAGSCGTALHTHREVVVGDIATDPLWAGYRSAALPFGLQACASVPVLDEGRALASFALYLDRPGPFTVEALDLLRRFTHLAGLALRASREVLRHQENEARYRAVVTQSQEGIFLAEIASLTVTEANPALLGMLGYTEAELIGLPLFAFIGHPREEIEANARRIASSGQHQMGLRTYLTKAGAPILVEASGSLIRWQGRQALLVVVRDVQERRRQELERITHAERFREILDQSGDIVTLVDQHGHIQYESSSLLRITGWEPGERVGRSSLERIHPEDVPAVQAALAAAMAGETKQQVVFRYQRKDGAWIFLESVGHLVKDAQGFEGLVITSRDVSERVAMERALRDSEERLREAQALGSLGHWSYDLRTGAITWSDEVYRIFRRDQALGPPSLAAYQAMFRPRDWDLVRANLEVALSSGVSQSFDIPLHWPDGSVTWHRGIQQPIFEDGQPIRVVGVAQDITERKAAEQALRESARVFRDLFEASPIPLALVEAEGGVIRRINRSALALFGLGPEVVGTAYHHQAYFSQDERNQILARLEAEGSVQDLPVRMHTIHGLSQVLVSANRLVQDGRPCVLLAYRDITAQQQQEEAQRQSQKLESLGILAGGIAHDFNNILTAILGNLSLAQAVLSPESPAQTFLQNMEGAVNKASALSRQMLAYSGRGRFRVEPVDLGRLGQEMAHLISASISKRVRLVTDLPTGLALVQGDPSQLQQVLLNLLTNASEAMGDKDGTLRVSLALTPLGSEDLPGLAQGADMAPGPHLRLEIQDDGVGMAPEVVARIFDPFFSTKGAGRGLGLSAILGIVRGHKGGLKVLSEPGRGTTFQVFLPCSPVVPEAPSGAAPTAPATGLHGRVLLVDDEPPLRQGVAMMLEHMGFEVEEAQDGVEALDIASRDVGAYRCVILDLTMPRMDGMETLSRLRALRPDLPVLLSSGYSDQGESLPPSPNLAFLSKPYRMSDLREALTRLLGASL